MKFDNFGKKDREKLLEVIAATDVSGIEMPECLKPHVQKLQQLTVGGLISQTLTAEDIYPLLRKMNTFLKKKFESEEIPSNPPLEAYLAAYRLARAWLQAVCLKLSTAKRERVNHAVMQIHTSCEIYITSMTSVYDQIHEPLTEDA